MKINKEMLRELSRLPDKELWQVITEKAAKFGYSLPKEAPSAENMAKIRAVMNDADKVSTSDILKLMSTLKSKKGQG